MQYKKTILLLLFFIGLTSSTLTAQYFPDSNWERKSPNALAMNKSLLDSAIRLAVSAENPIDRNLDIAIQKAFGHEPYFQILGETIHRGEPAGLVIKNGYIVAEWGDLERVDMTFSVAKSYLSTVAGIALQEGLINSLDEKVVNYVWDGTFAGAHNGQISWEHLLNQSSDWSGQHFGLYDWADRPDRSKSWDEWKNRELHTPGLHYKYNDVRVNVLAYSLLQVFRQPLPQVLKNKIMDPIGASTTWRWLGYHNSFVNVDGLMMQSVSGGGHFGGGLFINTYDHARFGLLFLRQGKWAKQQLLDREWIKKVQEPSEANPSYGLMWWNNSQENWKGLPKELYYAAGFGGNYIIIDESRDLLVVTRWMDNDMIDDFMRLVLESIE